MTGEDVDVERLVEVLLNGGDVVAEFKRAVAEGEEGDVLDLAGDVWELLDEIEDVLGTVDVAALPDTIDAEELPDTVDLAELPAGLLDEDETAVDLTELQDAVDMRALWEAVDLLELREEKQELEAAADEVTDDFGDGDDGEEGEDDDLFENVVGTAEDAAGEVKSELRQAALEEKIEAAVREFREALLATHGFLRDVYEANQEKLGQPDSLNPSAYSSMPPGPVPDSVSTRASTVPSQVKYSRVDAPKRIYGRRFGEARREAEARRESDTDDAGREVDEDD